MERSRYKEIAIVSFVALYTIIFFAFAASLMSGLQEFTISATSTLTIAGIVWVAIVAIASVLALDKGVVAFVISVIPAVTLVLVGRLSLPSAVGSAILFLLTFLAQRSIFQELQRYVRIRMNTVCAFGVRMLLFGMLVSFIAGSVPLIQSTIGEGNLMIPEYYTKSIAKSSFVSSWAKNTIPGYEAGKTVDEMITGQEGNPAYIKQELRTRLQIEVQGNETGSELIAKALNAYVARTARGQGVIVIVIVIAVALLAVRTIVPIISWPTLFLVTILFWIAKKTSLVSVAERTVPVEYIEL